jgi:hypothetical protein
MVVIFNFFFFEVSRQQIKLLDLSKKFIIMSYPRVYAKIVSEIADEPHGSSLCLSDKNFALAGADENE